jgi:hypothetical protein
MTRKAKPQKPAESLSLQCASIQLAPDPNHPNRVPFRGVVAKLDQPSDGAPHGTMGRRIIIPASLAAELSPGLLLAPINIDRNLSGHDLSYVIGSITNAYVEGSDWIVEGVLFGKNFPSEVDLIKAEKDSLGMSIEMSNLQWDNPFALGTIVMKMATPTGAAILLKKKAAYQTTTLAASRSEVNKMDPIIAQLLAQMVQMQASQSELTNLLKTMSAGITDAVTKLTTVGSDIKSQLAEVKAAAKPEAVVAPVEPKTEIAAAAVDPNAQLATLLGQALVAKLIGGDVKAAATPVTVQAAPVTPVPTQPDLAAMLTNLLTKGVPTEVAAAAQPAPARQTLSSDASNFVNRYNSDLKAGTDGKYTLNDVDNMLDKGGYSALQGTSIKMSLRSSGLI